MAQEPVFALELTKWKVEYQKGKNDLIIRPESMNHSVNLFKCDDCVLQIMGKVNSIFINNCNRIGVVFSDIIASVEVVNSKKVQLQASGNIANIQLDNVHGATLFFTAANKDGVEIITSNVTEVNVCVPGASANDDPREIAIPQQFVTKFIGDKLVTAPTEHVGV